MLAVPPDDPALQTSRVVQEDGTADPHGVPALDSSTLWELFRQMMRIRVIDERMLARQRQGRVGFYGTITGQEAAPVATAAVLRPQDWVFPGLRESAVMLGRGFPLTTWLAQVYGNEADLLRGRQMPSHMSGRQVHQVAWSSSIGPQIPQAVGAAWAAKHRGEDAVVVGFLGDGATSQGDFHAAMNFAGVSRPPCVLICQNNHWSISVPSTRQTASASFAVKAYAYGLPARRVDGNDVLGMYHVLGEAVDRARRGHGPTFVEAVTYRIGPHSSSDDPSRYRSEEEVAHWKHRDPLVRFERYLRSLGLMDDSRRQTVVAALEQELDEALAYVEPLGPPPRETMFDDVYGNLPWHLREQRAELERGYYG